MFDSVKKAYRSEGFYPAVRVAAGRAIQRVGERLSSNELIYNRFIFEELHRIAVSAAPGLVRVLQMEAPAFKSVVDLGAGTGAYVHALRQRGVEADGYEYSGRARRMAAKLLDVQLQPLDFTKDDPVVGPADLAISIEMAEHVPPALGRRLVQKLVAAAPLTLFTAAHPGQGGSGT